MLTDSSLSNVYFYDSDGKKYTNKYEALKYGKDVKLYYYDDIWSAQDWKQEPAETLDELYVQNLKRIRNSTDYMVLAFSGGVDSANILELCINYDIKIDEVLVVGALSQDKLFGDDTNHNGELYYNVFPIFAKYGIKNYQIYDYSTRLLKGDHPFFDAPQSLLELGWYLSPTHWFWSTIETDLYSKKPNMKLVMGIDKPVVTYHDFHVHFKEQLLFQYGIGSMRFQPYANMKREYFYWSPLTPKILIKQSHTLMNFFNRYVNPQTHTNEKKISFDVFNTNYDKFLTKLLYPSLTMDLPFKSPKGTTRLFSLRDTFFFQTKTPWRDRYYDMVSPLVTGLYDKNIESKKYYLK